MIETVLVVSLMIDTSPKYVPFLGYEKYGKKEGKKLENSKLSNKKILS